VLRREANRLMVALGDGGASTEPPGKA
jgi:hypothetical protein